MHNFETITYPMSTVYGKDTRSKSRVTIGRFSAAVFVGSACLLVSMVPTWTTD